MKDMETVNSGTAAKLKAAGFPQPEPQRGQVWRKVEDVDEYELLVIDEYEFTHVIAYGKFEQEIILKEDFNELAYMPTATDILRELGHQYFVGQCENKEEWYLGRFESLYGRVEAIFARRHRNSAEVSALEWLERNSK